MPRHTRVEVKPRHQTTATLIKVKPRSYSDCATKSKTESDPTLVHVLDANKPNSFLVVRKGGDTKLHPISKGVAIALIESGVSSEG